MQLKGYQTLLLGDTSHGPETGKEEAKSTKIRWTDKKKNHGMDGKTMKSNEGDERRGLRAGGSNT